MKELVTVETTRTTVVARIVSLVVQTIAIAAIFGWVKPEVAEKLQDPEKQAALQTALNAVAALVVLIGQLPSAIGWRTREREKRIGEIKPPSGGICLALLLGCAAFYSGCRAGNLMVLPGAAEYNDGKTRVAVSASVAPGGAGKATIEAESLDRSTTPSIRVSQPDPWTVRASYSWRLAKAPNKQQANCQNGICREE
ncbi:MAG: hypothetical protein N2111_14275 [Candidatus Sumerlaeaceae bacterium]|nr:hypothetical protein [Candidatus Sumerlaeaceae bacterium]